VPSPPADRTYWDGVASEWLRARRYRLWREFTDTHQSGLVARWIGALHASARTADHDEGGLRLLKTDLFDEVAGRGVVQTLISRGIQVTGVDIAPTVVAEAARRNAGLNAVASDVRSLPFADASFDAVFSGSTLDHFDDAHSVRQSLAELRRVLRPGGHLILTMDNPANPIIWIRNGPLLPWLRRAGIVPYQVGRALGPRALAASVRDAGFHVNATTAVMHCPRVLAVGCSTLVDRGPRACHDAFLRALMACEALERLPTRWLTGHYIAVHATVPDMRHDAGRCPA
jgi:SAM-dependent methyltransferase